MSENDNPPIQITVGVVETDDGPHVRVEIRQGSFAFAGNLPTHSAYSVGASLIDTAESLATPRPPAEPPALDNPLWRAWADAGITHRFVGRVDRDCLVCGRSAHHPAHTQHEQQE